MSFVVHKFGGTSVKDAEMMRRVAEIVRSDRAPGRRIAVVVSAMSKVTDALFDLCARAGRGDDVEAPLAALLDRHFRTIDELGFAADASARLRARFTADADGLRQLLRAVRVLRAQNAGIDEVVAGHGEVWSAQIVAQLLGVPFMDARDTLIVDESDLGPIVDDATSRKNVAAFFANTGADLAVITGYVASTRAGVPTTLKRNGSDFSASIFASLLDAERVTIWTDVDGVLSADPRRVAEAVVLSEMSYEEAMELAYFGAKVVHPRTMQPCVDRAIPIWIRNTFRPEVRGTVIHKRPTSPVAGPVIKGFTTIDEVSLLNLEGSAMVGVPGIAERLFGALRAAKVSVVVISQASSEHSICFAVPKKDTAVAKAVVDDAFAGKGAAVHVVDDCAVIAAVGDGMAQRPGIAGQFFTALGDAGVSVRAVAQGSSERNVTAVIDAKDSTRALRAVHARFTLEKTTLSIGVVGPGGIGQELLKQIAAQRDELRARFHVDVRVTAVARRDTMVLDDAAPVPLDWAAFAAHVRPPHLPHAVIVDCSAADDVADRYAGWLRAGIHVVTPNKRAASGPLARWRDIKAAAAAGHATYRGEATVGAGLPVIATLKELQLTGDTVVAVEGVLSGTLSWIMNTWQPGEAFSSLVREARRRGYTEPDPREDLSGLDFARKLVVLAREMGKELSLDDIDVTDLAPGCPFGAPLETLIDALQAGVDDALAARQRAALAEGKVLRMVGRVPESGRASVSLEALPLTHPFARLDGADNMIAFRTTRYATRPLVIQGPGAGAEVTAGGVFGDVLRIAAHLGGELS